MKLTSGNRRRITLFLERVIKPLAVRRLKGIVAVTPEIAEFELARFPWVKIKNLCYRVQMVQYGTLSLLELAELYEIADVGLCSFVLFRTDMRQACTLKVREYSQSGIPVFSGRQDSGLSDSFPYYKFDSEHISVKALLAFAVSSKGRKREEVQSASREYIDQSVLMRKLASELVSSIGTGA